SPNRSSYADEPWMEKVKRLNISRLVTVGYVALIKINNRVKQQSSSQKGQIVWLNIEDYRHEHLAFDHKDIIAAALESIRLKLKYEPYLMFELLPKKFTMTQLRNLHDTIYQKKSDVRNFQKRMMQLEGISVLAETEVGVPHRAARYFTYTKRKNKNE
ncbi:MAG: DNA mismatch repair protein MutT, partial [Paludibacteraceae bacterium]|nr:DNA mismatch repair protein MutT [Paludibacteraceae bacterium]